MIVIIETLLIIAYKYLYLLNVYQTINTDVVMAFLLRKCDTQDNPLRFPLSIWFSHMSRISELIYILGFSPQRCMVFIPHIV